MVGGYHSDFGCALPRRVCVTHGFLVHYGPTQVFRSASGAPDKFFTVLSVGDLRGMLRNSTSKQAAPLDDDVLHASLTSDSMMSSLASSGPHPEWPARALLFSGTGNDKMGPYHFLGDRVLDLWMALVAAPPGRRQLVAYNGKVAQLPRFRARAGHPTDGHATDSQRHAQLQPVVPLCTARLLQSGARCARPDDVSHPPKNVTLEQGLGWLLTLLPGVEPTVLAASASLRATFAVSLLRPMEPEKLTLPVCYDQAVLPPSHRTGESSAGFVRHIAAASGVCEEGGGRRDGPHPGRRALLVQRSVTAAGQPSRAITNLEGVIRVLRKAGFDTVDVVDFTGLSAPEQLRHACRASLVVGVHGAGMAWSSFASNGRPRRAAVLELSQPLWPKCAFCPTAPLDTSLTSTHPSHIDGTLCQAHSLLHSLSAHSSLLLDATMV